MTEPSTLLVEKKELDELESFGVIRREATDGIHVRM